ncbi:MAG: UbiA family prenyltransferase, partial [Halieaceae bacterium]|nr:UbiA family prenyltransferase [Halieaceae bacterium]
MMSESTAPLTPLWQDYLELTKPRVVALMIVTALIGMCMAVPGWVPWQPLVLGNLGIALCAGAAAAINHIVDERIDQQMARTQARPVATGRITQRDAILFAAALA